MSLLEKIKKNEDWASIEIKGDIPHGDMPGDKVQIEDVHIQKAETIFRELLTILPLYVNNKEKVVLSVCGGSGVGKSEIASLLTYYFEGIGVKSYTLSGDNYPHRIPKYNDAERLRVFREGGTLKLVNKNILKREHVLILRQLQQKNLDADKSMIARHEWLAEYQEAGADSLNQYLGTESEIGFREVSNIIQQFKAGAQEIYLRRMGRTESELWYEEIDFSETNVLIIEWTHGNNDLLEGVDVPILLNSTPEETLEHRRSRNRDGSVDSPFTQMVLEIEQDKLKGQAHKAQIILSKGGEILDFEKYREIMGD